MQQEGPLCNFFFAQINILYRVTSIPGKKNFELFFWPKDGSFGMFK